VPDGTGGGWVSFSGRLIGPAGGRSGLALSLIVGELCPARLNLTPEDLCTGAMPGVTSGGGAMNEKSRLMTIDEVAQLLHYSVKTVYKKAARGEIPSVVLSTRKRLFDREIINYWLVQRQTGDL
jgi:excisionase family DNA binding protein